MTDTLEKPDVDSLMEEDIREMVTPYEDNNDPSLRTHIVNPPRNTHIWQPGMTAQEIVNIARATGNFVVSLCGYKWVPVHNPDKYDVCGECFRVAGEIDRSM